MFFNARFIRAVHLSVICSVIIYTFQPAAIRAGVHEGNVPPPDVYTYENPVLVSALETEDLSSRLVEQDRALQQSAQPQNTVLITRYANKVTDSVNIAGPELVVDGENTDTYAFKFDTGVNPGDPCIVVEFDGLFYFDPVNRITTEFYTYDSEGLNDRGINQISFSETANECDATEGWTGYYLPAYHSEWAGDTTEPSTDWRTFEIESSEYFEEPQPETEFKFRYLRLKLTRAGTEDVRAIRVTGKFQADNPDALAGAGNCDPCNPLGQNPEEGRPVDPATGNYTYSVEDISLEGVNLPLSFRRSYSHAHTRWHHQFMQLIDRYPAPVTPPFPAGWTHNYHTYLVFKSSPPAQANEDTGYFYDPYGARHEFKVTGRDIQDHITGVQFLSGYLASLAWDDVSSRYLMQMPSGELYQFDDAGRLKELYPLIGAAIPITFEYTATAPIRLTAIQYGSSRLMMTYESTFGFLSAVTSQVAGAAGPGVSYSYDSVEITAPNVLPAIVPRLKEMTDVRGKTWVYGYVTKKATGLGYLGQAQITFDESSTATTIFQQPYCEIFELSEPFFGRDIVLTATDRVPGPVGNNGGYIAYHLSYEMPTCLPITQPFCESQAGYISCFSHNGHMGGDGIHIFGGGARLIKYVMVGKSFPSPLSAIPSGYVTLSNGRRGLPSDEIWYQYNTVEPIEIAGMGVAWLTKIKDPYGRTVEKQEYYGQDQDLPLTELDRKLWGRVVNQWNGENELIASFAYSPTDAGSTTTVTDGLGNQRVYTYDRRWRHLTTTINGITVEKNAAYTASHRPGQTRDGNLGWTDFTWTTDGRYLTSETDPTDRTTYYTRDATYPMNVEVVQVGECNPGNNYDDCNRTRFEYSDPRFPTLVTKEIRVTDLASGSGYETTYVYNANAQVEVVTDAEGNVTRYYYDASNPARLDHVIQNLVGDGIFNPVFPDKNIRTDFDYDSAGRVARVVTYRGTIAPDLSLPPDPVTTATQRVDVYEYDSAGNITKSITNYVDGIYSVMVPDEDIVTIMTYDDAGNLVQTIEAAGALQARETRLIYDDDSRIAIAIRNYKDGTFSTGSPDEDVVTEFYYDSNGNVVSTKDAAGRVDHICYDGLQRPFKYIVSAVSPDAAIPCGDLLFVASSDPDRDIITSLIYDNNGNITSVTNAVGTISTFGYDAANRQMWSSDAGIALTQITYDGIGNPVRVEDSIGRDSEMCYDALNRVVRRVSNITEEYTSSVCDEDFNGETRPAENLVETYTYDSLDRVTSQRDFAGRETRYDYDDLGRLTTVTANFIDGVFSPSNPDVDIITRMSFDPFGDLVESREITDLPLNDRITRFEYDRLGRRTAQILNYVYGAPLSADANITTTWTLDVLGRVVSETDPLNHVTVFSYDALDRLKAVTDPLSHTTDYTYDALGNIDFVEDAMGKITDYSYDAVYRQTRVTSPLGIVTRVNYDKLGRVVDTFEADESPDPNDVRTHYEYDQLGRIIRVTENHSPPYAINNPTVPDRNVQTSYSYDNAGRLLSVALPPLPTDTGGLARYDFAYDALDRRVLVDGPFAGSVDQWTTTYFRDMSRVEDRQPGLSFVEATILDKLHRIDAIQYRNSTNQADVSTPDVDFAYDALGRRTSMLETTSISSRTTTFDYDRVDRVTNVASPEGTIGYGYDAAGRRTSLTMTHGQTKTASYAYDAADRLVNVTGWTDGGYPAALVGYTYDALNRLTAMTMDYDNDPGRADYSHILDYDDDSRLTHVSASDAFGSVFTESTYTYNAQGNRSTESIENVSFLGSNFSEETHPNFVYSGTWNPTSNTNASGGSYSWSDDINATVSFVFYGTGIVIYHRMTEAGNFGPMKVCVDDPDTTDCAYTTPNDESARQRPFVIDGLPLGIHEVVIENPNQDSQNPTGLRRINLDAIYVLRELAPTAAGVHEESAIDLDLTPDWTLNAHANANGGIYYKSEDLKAVARFRVDVTTAGTYEVYIRARNRTDAAYGHLRLCVYETGAIVGTCFKAKLNDQDGWYVKEGPVIRVDATNDFYVVATSVKLENPSVNIDGVKIVAPSESRSTTLLPPPPVVRDADGNVFRGIFAPPVEAVATDEPQPMQGADPGAPVPDAPATFRRIEPDVVVPEVPEGYPGVFGYHPPSRESRSSGTGSETVEYTYDALQRLVEAEHRAGTTVTRRYSYAYDLRSNRVMESVFDGTSTTSLSATYNVANQIVSQGASFAYDLRGNLIDDGVWDYTYDSANRLIQAIGATSDGVEISYNGLGDRVDQTRILTGTTTSYLLDLTTPLTQVLGEFAPGSETWNLLGLDVIAQQTGAGAWNYLHTDGLGSVRAISTQTGDVSFANYAPYGMPLGADLASSFGYTGEMTDDLTGLVYLRARYYHPTSGTFLTQDPVLGVVGGPASTFNPYSYVRGNPVNLTDPSGRIAPLVVAGAAALIGGLVGGLVGLAGDLIHQLQQNGGNLGCINVGQMLREGLKGLIAGAAGGLAFAAALTGALSAAIAAIGGVTSSLAAWAGGALAAAGAMASGLLQRAWSGITSAANWLGNQLSSAWQGVTNWVSNASRAAYQPLMNMDQANCMLLEAAVVGADIPGCGLAGQPYRFGGHGSDGGDPDFGPALGEHSGRRFDPNYDPDPSKVIPIRSLSYEKIKITQKGIDVVEKHLSRFGPDVPNDVMLNRLRRIVLGELAPEDVDFRFYSHELREYVRYRGAGWAVGSPPDFDEAHRLWNNVHTMTLEDYRIHEKLQPLYHASAK